MEMQDDTAYQKKIPYPKAVFFVVVTEFCERFAYYGMRAVLTIYMRNQLNFSDDLSTTIYHVFLFLCYFLPLFGAILADSFLGKYRTVLALSSIFAVGNILLTLAATPPLPLPRTIFSLFGLFLMAVGTGGIKPCVVALGGDQFKLPEQEKQLKRFFSVFLFAVSVGNMCSTVLTPVLRRDVQCFGDDCYTLAFGVPAALMILAISIFTFGKSLYKINKPKENIILRVTKCIGHALSRRKQLTKLGKDETTHKHWIDYAGYEGSKYDASLIKDTKGLLRVLVYYLPIPMFWALYEQLGSRWTLQATRMDGSVFGYVIKPDQMQVTNAILMFTFIPLFEGVILPIFHRFNFLKRPLQRMVVGGLLAASSFGLASYTELRIQGYSGHTALDGYLSVISTLPTPVHLRCNKSSVSDLTLEPHTNVFLPHSCGTLSLTTGNLEMIEDTPEKFHAENLIQLKKLYKYESAVLVPSESSQQLFKVVTVDLSKDLSKSKQGNAKIIVQNLAPLSLFKSVKTLTLSGPFGHVQLPVGDTILKQEITPGTYNLELQPPVGWNNSGQVNPTSLEFRTGGNYMVVVTLASGRPKAHVVTLVPPNEINILWQLPQYVLMAWAEILFIISGMEFSFTEAPVSMKSVMQSCWHLTNATGNLMVIVATQIKGESQAAEFLIFAILMVIDAIIMALMARKYRYVSFHPESKQIAEKQGTELEMPTKDTPTNSPVNEETLVTSTKL